MPHLPRIVRLYPAITRLLPLLACLAGFVPGPSARAGLPFGGVYRQMPGRIEAEDFDAGGEGRGYHDTDPANQGGRYRPEEGVDIEECTDDGGGFNVGWSAATEWFTYTVDFPRGGFFDLLARAASATEGGTFRVFVDGVDVTGPMTIPFTGGWQAWRTFTNEGSVIEAGRHVVRVEWEASQGANLNWIEFVRVDDLGRQIPAVFWNPEPLDSEQRLGFSQLNARSSVPGTFEYQPRPGTVLAPGRHPVTALFKPGSTAYWSAFATAEVEVVRAPKGPYLGVPWAIPGRIEAEGFDSGGEGSGYHDADPEGRGWTEFLVDFRPGAGVDLWGVPGTPFTTRGETGLLVIHGTRGEWTEYTANVTRAGRYRIQAAVNSLELSSRVRFEVRNRDGILQGAGTVTWQPGPEPGQNVLRDAEPKEGMTLSAGLHQVRMLWEEDGTDDQGIDWFSFLEIEGPFGGVARTIPGILQAEDFDLGGEGVGFHDNEPQNIGGRYRPESGVDIEETTDLGGGYDVGWTDGQEWLEYTVDVARPGPYSVSARVASESLGGQVRIDVMTALGAIEASTVLDVPVTGGWQTWKTVSNLGLVLSSGNHRVRLTWISDGGGNLNWIAFEAGPGPIAVGPRQVPGRIEAEDFGIEAGDSGLNGGIGYLDREAANLGGQYRLSEGVDIQVCEDDGGGYNVFSFEPGEALYYSLRLTRSGRYRLSGRAASGAEGGRLPFILYHWDAFFSFDQPNTLWKETLVVPPTGGGQGWTTVEAGAVFELPAAYYILEIRSTGGVNLNWVELSEAGETPRVPATFGWANPASIVYGTPLGQAQLADGGEITPGTYEYTPRPGTVLAAGQHELKAVFTPQDSTRFEATSRTVTLLVTPAPLTIRADDKTMVAGGAMPTLTATYSGFVNGDTVAGLASPARLGTTATSASSPGTYPITVVGAASPNYTITHVNGTLRIGEPPGPVALGRTLSTTVNRPVGILLEARTEGDGSPLFLVDSPPAHGRLTGAPPRLLYVPNDHFIGQDGFAFRVTQSGRTSPPATILVDVLGTESKVAGTALNFDGVDDLVAVDGTIALAGRSFTVEAWVKPDIQGVNNFFVAQGNGGPNTTLHIGYLVTGVLKFGFGNNDLDTPVAYADRDWHHWACVYSSSGRSKRIYRDGRLVASGTGSADYSGSGLFTLGASPQVPSYFKGEIDEVRIWRVPRSAEEILAGYRRQLAGTETGLVAYWRFDEGAGASATNRVPGTAVARSTLRNGPGWGASGVPLGAARPVLTDFRPLAGRQGLRLSFDGIAGAGYQIEASDDLVRWEVVGATDTETPGREFFQDADPAHRQQRYYRVRAP